MYYLFIAIVRHNEESFRKRLAACADDEERKYLLNHCYSVAQHGDDVLESLGSTGVYNHSKTPTTGGGDVLQKITGKTGSLKPEGWPDDKPFDEINCNFALRDIKAGLLFRFICISRLIVLVVVLLRLGYS